MALIAPALGIFSGGVDVLGHAAAAAREWLKSVLVRAYGIVEHGDVVSKDGHRDVADHGRGTPVGGRPAFRMRQIDYVDEPLPGPRGVRRRPPGGPVERESEDLCGV